MTYLLAKILFLLVIAALLGAWFARWWLRRHYEDVTSDYLRLTTEGLSWRKAFEDKLAQRPEPDLNPILARLGAVEQAVKAITIPAAVDLTATTQRLGALESAIKAIAIPPAVDLTATTQRLGALESAIKAIAIPPAVDLTATTQRLGALESAIKAIAIPPAVDLTATTQRLGALESAVKAIAIPPAVDLTATTQRLGALESAVKAIAIPPAVDLTATTQRLGALESAVKAIAIPPPANLVPTTERLDALERAVRAIVIPAPVNVDLQPLMLKLESLQKAPPMAAPPASAPAAPGGPVVRAGSKNLLAHAAFGKPDDLQQIHGVKTVMEKMLHGIGVYYFWQIAEWTPADVVHADAQLTAFKGRIERDSWVQQAKSLEALPGSARKPENL